MYELRFAPDAEADLAHLSQAASQRVLKKLRWLAENLDVVSPEPLAVHSSAEPDEEGLHAFVRALPGCHTFADTPDEVRASILEATGLHVPA